MEPSSSNTGFFQRLPVLENQFHDDVSHQRIARCMYHQRSVNEILYFPNRYLTSSYRINII